jgi:ADP-ribosyl-[dinitrogen reductase] hydrolase
MTMPIRTSRESPLAIAEVTLPPGAGRLGLTLCPGKKDPVLGWDRDLGEDLARIQAWGASTVVTLLEEQEFRLLRIESLGADVARLGMAWLHLPIRDVEVPDGRFERTWETEGPALHRRLDAGERVLIHCRGGLGRTGLVAALILVERGSEPRVAIDRVRAVRPHAVETRAQEDYVLAAAAKGMRTALGPD